MPIPNTSLVIVDLDTMEPVPQGTQGEILLGGRGIALGYLNLPEKTAEKFVTIAGRRMYRTGDLGRVRPDGNVEFGGRVDLQVKIDGERIELGEIETCLKNAPTVHECAIDARAVGPTGKKQIVAYVVAATGKNDSDFIGVLRQYAGVRLARKLCPSHYVVVPHLPLTANGKVDRRALPDPAAAHSTSAPHTAAPDAPHDEESLHVTTLRSIIATELKIDVTQVSHDTNVFELGASSSQAATIILTARESMGALFSATPLNAFFAHPTPGSLVDSVVASQVSGGDFMTVRELNTLAQTTLDDSFPHLPPCSPSGGSDANDSHRRVLLTGSTGFLGAYLLCDLLAIHARTHVVCLVRADTCASAERRVMQNLDKYGLTLDATDGTGGASRVSFVCGDVAQPRLGLDDDVYTALAGSVTSVFHCASMVHYGHSYATLEHANVLGTAHILQFCADGRTTLRKSLHYISTLGVFPVTQFHSEIITEASQIATDGVIATGYSQSKFVADALVRKFTARYPEVFTDVCIYRPARIVGDSRTGKGPDDFLFRFLELCMHVGAVPNDVAWDIDATCVDSLSACIVHLAAAQDETFDTAHVATRPEHVCMPLEQQCHQDTGSADESEKRGPEKACCSVGSTTGDPTKHAQASPLSNVLVYHLHNSCTQTLDEVGAWLGLQRRSTSKPKNGDWESLAWTAWYERCLQLLRSSNTTASLKSFIPILSSTADSFQSKVPFPLAPQAISCARTAAALEQSMNAPVPGATGALPQHAVGVGGSIQRYYSLLEKCMVQLGILSHSSGSAADLEHKTYL
eukprot:m.769107 g.769107  ORF g.769107 m.769107 type:complete len:803 (+) comp23235_c0_seq5:1409-3817(+)